MKFFQLSCTELVLSPFLQLQDDFSEANFWQQQKSGFSDFILQIKKKKKVKLKYLSPSSFASRAKFDHLKTKPSTFPWSQDA